MVELEHPIRLNRVQGYRNHCLAAVATGLRATGDGLRATGYRLPATATGDRRRDYSMANHGLLAALLFRRAAFTRWRFILLGPKGFLANLRSPDLWLPRSAP